MRIYDKWLGGEAAPADLKYIGSRSGKGNFQTFTVASARN
jgi:hypothetical protein